MSEFNTYQNYQYMTRYICTVNEPGIMLTAASLFDSYSVQAELMSVLSVVRGKYTFYV